MLDFRILSFVALTATLLEACTVLTEVDRDLVPDEPEAGADASPPPPSGTGGTAGSGGAADAAPDVAADAPADVVADAPEAPSDAGDTEPDAGGEAGVGDSGGIPDSSMTPE